MLLRRGNSTSKSMRLFSWALYDMLHCSGVTPTPSAGTYTTGVCARRRRDYACKLQPRFSQDASRRALTAADQGKHGRRHA